MATNSISSLHPNIFRTVTMREVLDSFKRMRQRPKTEHGVPLLGEHAAADEIFFASEEASDRAGGGVDRFISTALIGAAAERTSWLHSLALRHAANVRAAVIASVLVFLCGLGGLIFWQGLGAGLPPLLEIHVLYAALLLPCAVFLATLLYGHGLPGRAQSRTWIHAMCLHNSRTALRARALTALPEFVAASDRFIVCLSPEYFRSLRAIMEISTFCAARGLEAPRQPLKALGASSEAARRAPPPNASRVEFVPLSTAPWLVINQFLECLATIAASSTLLLPYAEAHVGARVSSALNSDAPLAVALAHAASLGAAALVARVPLIIYNAFSLSGRLDAHEATIKQLEEPYRALANAQDDEGEEAGIRTIHLRQLASLAVTRRRAAWEGSNNNPEISTTSGRASEPASGGASEPASGGGSEHGGEGGNAEYKPPQLVLENGAESSAGPSAADGPSPADTPPAEDAVPIVVDPELAAAEALSPWLADELFPLLQRRLGRASHIPLPLAALSVLPTLYHSAVVAFHCQGRCETFAIVRLARVPLALLAAPLAPTLALSLVSTCRRLLRRCCGCCCGRGRGEEALPVTERFLALLASTVAYVLAVAMAALPQFLLEPACFPGKDDPRLSDDGRRAESSAALGALCSSLAAIVALYSIALASSQPRAVLAVAALALATIGWVVYGDWVGLGA